MVELTVFEWLKKKLPGIKVYIEEPKNAGNRLLRNVPVDVTRFSIDLLTSLPSVKLPKKSLAADFIMLKEPDIVVAASLAVVPVIPICV